nr:hypothetical protein [Tanacetum cinerariifolium]
MGRRPDHENLATSRYISLGSNIGYEIQSSFALITPNDQGFTVDRNMDDFLVTENFGMILRQPVHTDDNVKTTKFNRHEIFSKVIVDVGVTIVDVVAGVVVESSSIIKLSFVVT